MERELASADSGAPASSSASVSASTLAPEADGVLGLAKRQVREEQPDRFTQAQTQASARQAPARPSPSQSRAPSPSRRPRRARPQSRVSQPSSKSPLSTSTAAAASRQRQNSRWHRHDEDIEAGHLWLGVCVYSESERPGVESARASREEWTATGYSDGLVRVFRHETLLYVLMGHAEGVAVCGAWIFLHGERLVLTTLDAGGVACWWEVERGQCLYKRRFGGGVLSCVCMPRSVLLCVVFEEKAGNVLVVNLQARRVVYEVGGGCFAAVTASARHSLLECHTIEGDVRHFDVKLRKFLTKGELRDRGVPVHADADADAGPIADQLRLLQQQQQQQQQQKLVGAKVVEAVAQADDACEAEPAPAVVGGSEQRFVVEYPGSMVQLGSSDVFLCFAHDADVDAANALATPPRAFRVSELPAPARPPAAPARPAKPASPAETAAPTGPARLDTPPAANTSDKEAATETETDDDMTASTASSASSAAGGGRHLVLVRRVPPPTDSTDATDATDATDFDFAFDADADTDVDANVDSDMDGDSDVDTEAEECHVLVAQQYRAHIRVFRFDADSLGLELLRLVRAPVTSVDCMCLAAESAGGRLAVMDETFDLAVAVLDRDYRRLFRVHVGPRVADSSLLRWTSASQLALGSDWELNLDSERVIRGGLRSRHGGDREQLGVESHRPRRGVHAWTMHMHEVAYCTAGVFGLMRFFMQWGIDVDLDAAVERVLGIRPPSHSNFRFLVHCAPRLDMYCVLADSRLRWSCSDRFTALQTLGLISLFISLIASDSLEEHQQAVMSSLVSHYGIVYPEQLLRSAEGYVFPCLELLARFILSPHASEDVQVASRLLLQVSIERMPLKLRLTRAAQWAGQLHLSDGRDKHAAVILGMLGVTHPEELAPATARLVAGALRRFVPLRKKEETVIAAELLARGFYVWCPYIDDLPALVRDLIVNQELPVREGGPPGTAAHATTGAGAGAGAGAGGSSRQRQAAGGASIASASHRALTKIAASQPLLFIQTVGREALRPGMHRAALAALGGFVRQRPAALLRHLPAVVEIVIRTLDPSESDVRKACLKHSTLVLHQIVKRFPMVAFHQQTQRFAVGTVDAIILVYDLRTATKWRILEGHTGPVSALAFEPAKGELIASYCAQECALRLWQTGASAGFFSGLLGIQGNCMQVLRLPPLPPPPLTGGVAAGAAVGGAAGGAVGGAAGGGRPQSPTSPADIVHNCDMTWATLVREDGRTRVSLAPLVAASR